MKKIRKFRIQPQTANLLRILVSRSRGSRAIFPEKGISSREENASPYFDERWYKAAYEDVSRSEMSAWQHFCQLGDRQNRQPGPYFDTAYYISHYKSLTDSAVGPLEYYESCGASIGHAPNPYFDPSWYSLQLDGQPPQGDLFLHYLRVGWRSGISPSPYFDIKWYLSRNPDIVMADVEPLRHYLEHGSQESRNPNAFFDIEYYNLSNADVRHAKIEPLKHYITHGWRETSRQPNEYFDKEWYKKQYMNCIKDNQDPLHHYIVKKSSHRVLPHPNFDYDFYLSQSPELPKESNAYLHFMTIGREEGRRPNARAQILKRDDIFSWAKANGARNRANAKSLIVRPLLRLLGHVDIVSFDIFNTLIERSSGAPESVFDMVSMTADDLGYTRNDYKEHRLKAEKLARHRSGRQEVKLKDIYEEFHNLSGASRTVCAALLEAEIKTELSVCAPKLAGQLLFDLAVRVEKDIILLTDTYLPETTVRAILQRSGYDRPFRLFVSSELGATKHYGHLFSYVIAQIKAKPDRIVHIGDNPYSDGEMARHAGFRTLLISKSKLADSCRLQSESPLDAARETKWAAIVQAELNARTNFVQIDERQHSDRGELNSIGTGLIGPILLGFTQFLAQKSSIGDYKQLFFASRDAFYMKEAYDIFKKHFPELPRSQYFYASRKVCRFALLRSTDDVLALAAVDHYPMTVRQFLTARFMAKEDLLDYMNTNELEFMNTKIVSGATDERLRAFLRKYSREILSAVEAHREAYMIYLASIRFGGNADAIVDIGYRGTIQRCLSQITSNRLGGIYLMTWPEAERLLADGMRFDAYLRNNQDSPDIINRNLQIFELVLSGTHASVERFSMKSGKPVPHLASVDTTATTRGVLNEIRQAALQFVDTMCERYGRLLLSTTLDPEAALTPLRNMLRLPPVALAEGLREHVVEDDFGGETRCLVIPPDKKISYNDALERSCWKEGTARVWQAERHGSYLKRQPSVDCSVDFFDGTISRPAFRKV